MSDMVTQRIQFQEERRQHNIQAVVLGAASELGDKRVKDQEPDHDWTARFLTEVQDVSSELRFYGQGCSRATRTIWKHVDQDSKHPKGS